MIIGYLFWGILIILWSDSLGTRKEEDDFKQTTNGTGEFLFTLVVLAAGWATSTVLHTAQMILLGGKSGLFEARNAVAQTIGQEAKGEFQNKGIESGRL